MRFRLVAARFAAVVAAVVALAGSGAARAAVTVTFVEAERFADIGFKSSDRREALDRLEAHLKHWGVRHLRTGESLAIDVLDVDLAGELRPGPRDDLRVLRGGADFPRMRLRYVLASGGRTLAAGEERLVDLDYLDRRASLHADEPLFYERRMLDDWLAARIVPLLASAR